MSGNSFLGWWEIYKFKFLQDENALRLSSAELEATEQRPTDEDVDMDVTELKSFEDGSKLYDVDFNIRSKSLSKKRYEISYSIAELYLGDMRTTTLAIGDALVINAPPNPWHKTSPGSIDWTRRKYDISIADGNDNKALRKWLDGRYAGPYGNNGLTSVLTLGEAATDEAEFYIRARPTQYVSVIYSFGVDNSVDVDGPDVGIYYSVSPLGNLQQRSRTVRVHASKM